MGEYRGDVLTGITNAASEGNNRLIKLEARNAFGFRNADKPTFEVTLHNHPASPARQTPRSNLKTRLDPVVVGDQAITPPRGARPGVRGPRDAGGVSRRNGG